MPSKPFSIAKGAGGLAGVARKFIQATSGQFASRQVREIRELLRIPRNRINSLRHYYFEEILQWNHGNFLLGYYPLGEESGATSIKDHSGNGIDGWTVGTLTLGTANKIKGTSFDKAVGFTNTGHIQLEIAGTTGPLRAGVSGAEFSIFGWFKRSTTGVGVNYPSAGSCVPLFTRGLEEGVNGWAENMNYGFMYNELSSVFRASAEDYNGGSGDHEILGSGTQDFDDWVFLCVTWETSPRELNLFVNGVLTGFNDSMLADPNWIGVAPASIGRAVSSAGVASGQFYGWAQHCGILTKRLTRTEVMELYLAGATES